MIIKKLNNRRRYFKDIRFEGIAGRQMAGNISESLSRALHFYDNVSIGTGKSNDRTFTAKAEMKYSGR